VSRAHPGTVSTAGGFHRLACCCWCCIDRKFLRELAIPCNAIHAMMAALTMNNTTAMIVSCQRLNSSSNTVRSKSSVMSNDDASHSECARLRPQHLMATKNKTPLGTQMAPLTKPHHVTTRSLWCKTSASQSRMFIVVIIERRWLCNVPRSTARTSCTERSRRLDRSDTRSDQHWYAALDRVWSVRLRDQCHQIDT